MKLTILYILTSIFAFGSIWFGRLAWLASQHSGTGYLGVFIGNGIIAIICILIAIGFGIWAILS